MQNGERLNLEQIQAFLEASEEIQFEAAKRQEVYEWITRALCEQEYWKQGRTVKGMLRRYIGKMTGLSRAQNRSRPRRKQRNRRPETPPTWRDDGMRLSNISAARHAMF
jgi:hypothetical protein